MEGFGHGRFQRQRRTIRLRNAASALAMTQKGEANRIPLSGELHDLAHVRPKAA